MQLYYALFYARSEFILKVERKREDKCVFF